MRVVIFGAGGHGKVVWDILTACEHRVVAFLDDAPSPPLLDLRVCTALRELPPFEGIVVAIGNNAVRREKYEYFRELGLAMPNAIHPTAIISRHAVLGEGTIVAPGVIVNIDARVGDNVILNTGASIDHDCTIESHAHIGPGAHLGGNVHVEEGAFLGIGSNVLPSIRVGPWATCGAGAVVTRDVAPGVTAVGVPAQPLARVSHGR